MSATPKVSVCITAYNHEAYIREAIDSVLAQKVNFPIEILIGEDCSTDGTRAIVQQYERNHPDLIRAFYHSGKDKTIIDGRVTGRKNFVNNLLHARGDYIALLDGDDFWINENKLATQVEFLDSNPSYSLCFHNAIHVNENSVFLDALAVPALSSELTFLDILKTNPVPTMSCLFSNPYFKELPTWFYQTDMGDWPLHIMSAARGKMRYMPVVMAAYRIHDRGIWQSFRDDEATALLSQIKVWQLLRENKILDDDKYFCRRIDMNYRRAIRGLLLKNATYEASSELRNRRSVMGVYDGFHIKQVIKIAAVKVWRSRYVRRCKLMTQALKARI